MWAAWMKVTTGRWFHWRGNIPSQVNLLGLCLWVDFWNCCEQRLCVLTSAPHYCTFRARAFATWREVMCIQNAASRKRAVTSTDDTLCLSLNHLTIPSWLISLGQYRVCQLLRRENRLRNGKSRVGMLVGIAVGIEASHVGSADESNNPMEDSLAREYPQSSESSQPLSEGRFLELLRATLVCTDGADWRKPP